MYVRFYGLVKNWSLLSFFSVKVLPLTNVEEANNSLMIKKCHYPSTKSIKTKLRWAKHKNRRDTEQTGIKWHLLLRLRIFLTPAVIYNALRIPFRLNAFKKYVNFLARPLFSSLALLPWKLFDLDEFWEKHSGDDWLTTCKLSTSYDPLDSDFVIGSRVGRASRKICAFPFDHFFLASTFTLKNVRFRHT